MAKNLGAKELLQGLFSVPKEERQRASLLFGWLFLFITTYYVLRPVRRGIVLDGLGNDNMCFVYMGTALVTGLTVYIYSRFAHLPRRVLIGTIYSVFFLNLLGFYFALPGGGSLMAGVFWVWLDVFSIMGVTLFWMYANDVYDSATARTLFGIISAGGGLGAVTGSSITVSLVKALGTYNMLLVAAALVLSALALFLTLEKTSRATHMRRPTMEVKKADLSRWDEVFKAILASRFLVFLSLLVCFERITPDFIQYLYNDVLHNMASGVDAITQLDAGLERTRGVVEFVVELCFVSLILKKAGTRFCLSSSAATILSAVVLFALVGNPLFIVCAFHLDEGMRHAWFKSAKELTYTVTSRDVLYNIKPVIEMFFYRFARGFAGLAIYFTQVLHLGVKGVMALTALSSFVWLFAAFGLTREFERLEKEKATDLVSESSKKAAHDEKKATVETVV
jgi:AAA family ATP:ADP antiporter